MYRVSVEITRTLRRRALAACFLIAVVLTMADQYRRRMRTFRASAMAAGSRPSILIAEHRPPLRASATRILAELGWAAIGLLALLMRKMLEVGRIAARMDSSERDRQR